MLSCSGLQIDPFSQVFKRKGYNRHLNVLNEGEMDIVDCGWSNYRMSEKSLIDYMERRIRGEKVKFPDDYFPF